MILPGKFQEIFELSDGPEQEMAIPLIRIQRIEQMGDGTCYIKCDDNRNYYYLGTLEQVQEILINKVSYKKFYPPKK